MEGKDMTGTGNTAEMISPRTARARKKRADLMDAAARLIAEKGYHETSMRDIAAELGMSAASLYHYFPGKEDLVVALQRECFEKLMCDAEAVLQPLADPVERIHAFIANHMRFFVQRISLIRVLVHEDCCLSKANREIIRSFKRDYVAICESLIDALPRAEGAPMIDRRLATFSLFGMLNWFYTWHHKAQDLGAEEMSSGFFQIFLRGYQGKGDSSGVGMT